MRDQALQSLRELNEVIERLRAPGGCPWDREQTHLSLRPYLLEETYEALEAIEHGEPGTLREELGDVLLQVLLHSAIAMEDAQEGFDIGDVAQTTREKLVHRHPHVFGDVAVQGAAEVVVNWERLKSAEKRERLSILEGVPRTLPALAYAQGMQKRPARVGFEETPRLEDALRLLKAAVQEIETLPRAQAAIPMPGQWAVDGDMGFRRGGTPLEADTPEPSRPAAASVASPGAHAAPPPTGSPQAEAAVGALLFAAVAAARRLRVNPEDALRRHATGFADRFQAVEATLRAQGRSVHSVEAAEWAELWERQAAP